MMNWLTQSKGELFQDEGQDAQRQKLGMEAQLSAQTNVMGRGAAPAVDALKQKFRSSFWSVSHGG